MKWLGRFFLTGFEHGSGVSEGSVSVARRKDNRVVPAAPALRRFHPSEQARRGPRPSAERKRVTRATILARVNAGPSVRGLRVNWGGLEESGSRGARMPAHRINKGAMNGAPGYSIGL